MATKTKKKLVQWEPTDVKAELIKKYPPKVARKRSKQIMINEALENVTGFGPAADPLRQIVVVVVDDALDRRAHARQHPGRSRPARPPRRAGAPAAARARSQSVVRSSRRVAAPPEWPHLPFRTDSAPVPAPGHTAHRRAACEPGCWPSTHHRRLQYARLPRPEARAAPSNRPGLA